jgi:hypothetical protein
VSWRRVTLLYVVLAALAAEYQVLERPRAAQPEPEAIRPRFLSVAAADMREVRLRRDGRTLVTRREGTTWAVVEPAGAAVPPDLIAAFANALAGAEEIARFAPPGGDAPTYGFADGARVEVFAGGEPPIVVLIGQTNPTGTAVYAQRAGAHEVVLIGRNVRYYEDLIFQALSASRVPEAEQNAPIGG